MSLPPSDTTRGISAPRQSAARDFYLAYLNSSGWRIHRNRALKLANFRCSQCGGKRDLNVHHKTYERLGAELDQDLEVLCYACHQGHHLEESEGLKLGVYVTLAREALKKMAFSSIADIVDATKYLCAENKVPYDTDLVSRAVHLVIGARQTMKVAGQTVPYRSVVEETGQITNAQAHELFCRLDLPMLLKTMPDAKPVFGRAVDRLKAAQMVAQEIQDSIARCEVLERQVEEP